MSYKTKKTECGRGVPIAKLAQKKRSSPWLSDLGRAVLSLAFVSFVAAAVAGIASPLFFAIVFSACLIIAVMRTLFPPGRLFPIAFASLLAVYAAIFSLFVDEIFRGIDDVALVVGFCLPIVFFVIGCVFGGNKFKTLVVLPFLGI